MSNCEFLGYNKARHTFVSEHLTSRGAARRENQAAAQKLKSVDLNPCREVCTAVRLLLAQCS